MSNSWYVSIIEDLTSSELSDNRGSRSNNATFELGDFADDSTSSSSADLPVSVMHDGSNSSVDSNPIVLHPLRTSSPLVDLTDQPEIHTPPPRSARSMMPDAIIDLCTPEVYVRRQQMDSRSASFEEPYKCPVCLDRVLKKEPTSTRCGHVFCKKCIETAAAVNQKCPLCKKKISKNSIFRLYL